MAQVRKLQLGLKVTHYDYNNRSLSSGNAWGMIGSGEDTMDSRLLNYATSLKTQTGEIANLYAKGNTRFHNLPKSVESYVNADNQLSNFINDVNSGKYTNDPTAGYNALARIAGTILPDSEAPNFVEYFLDYLPKKSDAEVNKERNKLSDYKGVLNPWLQKIIADNNYQLVTDNSGNLRIYNKDYSEVLKGLKHINSEPGDYNNSSILTDDEGNVYLGSISDPNFTPDNPVYKYWLDTSKSLVLNAKNLIKDIDWNSFRNDSQDPYYKALEKLFGGTYKGADISQLILGNERIFARGKNNNKPYTINSSGIITLDPNAEYYKVNEDGSVIPVNFATEIQPKFRSNGWLEENELGEYTDVNEALENADNTFDENKDLANRSFWDAIKAGWDVSDFFKWNSGKEGDKTKVQNNNISSGDAFAQNADMIINAGNKGAEALGALYSAWQAGKYMKEGFSKYRALRNVGKWAKVGKAFKGVGQAVKTGVGATNPWGLIATAAYETLAPMIRFNYWDNVNEDRPAFVLNVLNAVANNGMGDLAIDILGVKGNNDFLNRLNFRDNTKEKDEITVYMYNFFKQEKELFNALPLEYKDAFNKLKRDYAKRHSTPKDRFGGYILHKNITESVIDQMLKNASLVKDLNINTSSLDRFGEYLKSHK